MASFFVVRLAVWVALDTTSRRGRSWPSDRADADNLVSASLVALLMLCRCMVLVSGSEAVRCAGDRMMVN